MLAAGPRPGPQTSPPAEAALSTLVLAQFQPTEILVVLGVPRRGEILRGRQDANGQAKRKKRPSARCLRPPHRLISVKLSPERTTTSSVLLTAIPTYGSSHITLHFARVLLFLIRYGRVPPNWWVRGRGPKGRANNPMPGSG